MEIQSLPAPTVTPTEVEYIDMSILELYEFWDALDE